MLHQTISPCTCETCERGRRADRSLRALVFGGCFGLWAVIIVIALGHLHEAFR